MRSRRVRKHVAIMVQVVGGHGRKNCPDMARVQSRDHAMHLLTCQRFPVKGDPRITIHLDVDKIHAVNPFSAGYSPRPKPQERPDPTPQSGETGLGTFGGEASCR